MDKSLLSLSPQTKYNLLLLFAAGLFFWISVTCLLSTLPTYIQDVGASTEEIGLVMGCFAIGLLCFRPWLGQAADLRGRKLVILIGTLVAGIAPIGYLFWQSIGGLAAIRAFHGISVAAFTIGYGALVVDFAPRGQRATLIGYMNLVSPLGMGLGPALGGFLVVSNSYRLLFGVAASCGICSLVLATQLRKIPQNIRTPQLKTSEEQPLRSFKELVQDPALLTPTIVLLLVGLVFGTLITFLPLFARDLKLDFNVGFFYSMAAVSSFTVRLFIGSFADRYGRGIAISSSLVCYLVSMALLAIANDPSILLLSAFIEGIAGGISIPMILALISDRSERQEQGKVYAVCLGGFDLGMALAGPILGQLAQAWSYRGLFWFSTLLSAIAIIIFMTRSSKNLPHSLRFALGREADLYARD
ncbi:arabinose efflux permease family protein [Xenococcus sp. PCC 7305]|uniref:MFS transporter n=1 Tax=Xenococcus sp. PCC 7305 TaxID=102125 RepID=UPI0002ACD3F0|nr:MFS transporter [Xenococcus sp. PCC 7305]ELS02632.1 arabinose efflux permease family protein [Xenococcus sp. PCC 7305]